MANSSHKIGKQLVVVGGGAAGLELIARLNKKFLRSHHIQLTLVDCSLKHLWKPLLHELAAGYLRFEHELNYISYAYQQRFNFVLGGLAGLNRKKKTILIGPVLGEHNEEIIGAREIAYDTLIITIGSKANDFSVSGVKKYCHFLDDISQAEAFQKSFSQRIIRLIQSPQLEKESLTIVIVGGGATGVELASELDDAFRQAIKYSCKNEKLFSNCFKIVLVESGERILRNLPNNLAALITKKLINLGIEIKTGQTITEVLENGLITDKKSFIAADLMVWAAGIKASSILKNLDELEVNHLNQLQVNLHLQTTQDKHIFALGDCASCYQPQTKTFVPPRAQAAHQQAKFLAKTLKHHFNNEPLPEYYYRDYGSLISLSQSMTVGILKKLTFSDLIIDGKLAQFFYSMLYKQHQITLQGLWQFSWLALANFITQKFKPRLKLH